MGDASYPHQDATLRWERRRAFCTGLVHTAPASLVLLVAQRHFHASARGMSLLASVVSIGLLASPLALAAMSALRISVTRANALLYLGSSLGLAAAAAGHGFPSFLGGFLAGVPLMTATIPMSTALWRQNVPDGVRGRLYGQVAWMTALGALAGQGVMTWWIREDASRYPPLVAMLAVAAAVAAFCSARIPSLPVLRSESAPWRNLAHLWRDPLFGYVSAAWMLLGLGNLATIPLRVVYVSDPAYGLQYTEREAMLLIGLLPVVAQLAATPFWGRLFDRMDFIALRALLNVGFLASVALFFIPSWKWQLAASVVFGVSQAGGSLAWNMWVTLYAPPERTAAYMSIHTFLTGVRGLVAPALALHALAHVPIRGIAWSCGGLVAMSVVMLAIEPWVAGRAARGRDARGRAARVRGSPAHPPRPAPEPGPTEA